MNAFIALTRLSLLRVLRGWRWRTFLVLAIVASYWFGFREGFGTGAVVWFPGGPLGLVWLTLFFAAGSLLLGVEAVSQWRRYRASSLLEPRLISPVRFVLANVAALTIASVPVTVLAAFWSAVGAWRADLMVLWYPCWLYVVCVAVPVVAGACAAGFCFRALIPSDLGALAAGGMALVPLLAFRLWTAPAAELFQFATGTMGLLLPMETVVRDAVLCYMYSFLFVGLAMLLLPSPRPRHLVRGSWLRRALSLPVLGYPLRKLRVLMPQWGLGTAGISVVLIVTGAWALGELFSLRPQLEEPVRWEGLHPPAKAFRSPVEPPEILHRRIVLGKGPGEPVTVELSFRVRPSTATLAAFTFGPALSPVRIETASGEPVAPIPNAVPKALNAVLMDIERLGEDDEHQLLFTLEPHGTGIRDWRRAWHPRYHRFMVLGPWYGEGVRLNYAGQEGEHVPEPSPFTVFAPARQEPMRWFAGTASVRVTDGQVEIVQPLRDWPARLIASNLVLIEPPPGYPLDTRFALQQHREPLVEGLYIIYHSRLRQIARAFGDPGRPLILYEVPEPVPSDPLALPSGTLDGLETLLPRYRDFDGTAGRFEELFRPIHRGIVREIIGGSFRHIEHPELLEEGLAEYYHRYALGQGRYGDLARITRQDVVLVPWQLARNLGASPCRPDAKQKPRWEGPLFHSLRSPRLPDPAPGRPAAFFHMLRGMMEDDAFVAGTRAVIESHGGADLTLEIYRQGIEAAHGEPLDWFFDQWLVEGVTPSFVIEEAEAFLLEDPETRALQYHTRVRMANRGNGRMPVPWVLGTEGDPRSGKTWLSQGDAVTLEMTTLDRPIAFEIDPQGWVVNFPPPNMREATRVVFRTIRER